jgi:hypothetical protein
MKKYIILLITLIIGLALVSCSNTAGDGSKENAQKTASASAEQSDEATTQFEMTEYKTDFGSISYPKGYDKSLKIEEEKDEKEDDLIFNAEIDGKKYQLFTVVINDDSENYDGKILDENGKEHFVTVVMNELEVSELSKKQQDKLFSMQEMVNDIVDTLE